MITLTTDFGPGPYAGAMKAAILAVNPDARILDVTHDVPRHDVRAGAFILERMAPLFAKGTVHVAVVDPGVGTQRRGLVVETEQGLLVGPDNGLLIPAARTLGLVSVAEITERSLWRKWVSRTFHGRDIFAPVAAHLDAGTPVGRAGRAIDDPVELDRARPRIEGAFVYGTVMFVDGFGNVVTDVPHELVKGQLAPGDSLELVHGKKKVRASWTDTYGDADAEDVVALLGSFDTVEFAVAGGSGAAATGLGAGDDVRLRRLD